jgi:hypothetical protein
MRGLDPRIHQEAWINLVGWIAGTSLDEPGNDDQRITDGQK